MIHRESLRRRVCWRLITVGGFLTVIGIVLPWFPLPFPWVGVMLVVIGALGLLGVNVFIGGPLDRRRERDKQDRVQRDSSDE